MDSGIIVMLVLMALFFGGFGWVEIHSRRKKNKVNEPESLVEPAGHPVYKRVPENKSGYGDS